MGIVSAPHKCFANTHVPCKSYFARFIFYHCAVDYSTLSLRSIDAHWMEGDATHRDCKFPHHRNTHVIPLVTAVRKNEPIWSNNSEKRSQHFAENVHSGNSERTPDDDQANV